MVILVVVLFGNLLDRKWLVENKGDDQDLGRGEQGKREGKFPGPGGLAEGHDLGIIGCGSCHEEGKSVAGSARPGEKVGGQGAGAFGADFDKRRGNEGQGQASDCRPEPLGKG